MGQISLILWIVALCLIADAHKVHHLQTQDLQSIVDAIQKDVDLHLKGIVASSVKKHSKSISVPTKSKDQKSSEGMDRFIKALEDAMDHHLVRNLGPPSDLGYDSSSAPSTTKGYTKDGPSTAEPTNGMLTTESVSSSPMAQPSKSISKDEDVYESSTHGHPIHVGSIKGIPGVNFPDYTDIPVTSFTCSDKDYLPGFYADLDAGCQVFHVCWPDRRETFLCPLGTTFNQALLACDYWYNANCSLAPHYYNVNAEPDASTFKGNESLSSMINVLLEKGHVESSTLKQVDSSKSDSIMSASVLSFISQFIPVKAKVTIYPETEHRRSKIVASASVGGNMQWGEYDAKSHHKTDVLDKHQYVSTPSHIPLADEQPRSHVTHRKINEEEVKRKIFEARLYESLQRVLEEVQHDSCIVRYYEIVESVVTFIKAFWWDRAIPEVYKLSPGSELYEYDLAIKESMDKIPMLVKVILKQKAKVMDEIEHSVTHVHKPVSVKPAPLTNLNPRFIIKPATQAKDEMEKRNTQPIPPTKEATLSKRPATVVSSLNLSSRKNGLSISPKTKKALLDNYIRLLNMKAKNA